MHISSGIINLKTVLQPIAKSLGISYLYKQKTHEDRLGPSKSAWVVLTKDSTLYHRLIAEHAWDSSMNFAAFSVWSDQKFNILTPLFY